VKNILTALLLFVSFSINSQEKIAQDVFKKIVNSIGNNFNQLPTLEIVKTENNPAYYSPRDNKIYIEKKTLTIFENNKNFEDILAYLIAHELAHHYLNHGWMRNLDFGYSSTIGNFIIDGDNKKQKKIDETQADIFGGFFAKIAGYDALNFGEYCLREIYKEYEIPESISGYPSLSERIEIIESNVDKTNQLSKIFDLGNLFLSIGDYETANNCYTRILNEKFTSREIYNNIGVIYLLKAIDIYNSGNKEYIFPVYIEINSRANNNLSRAVDYSNIKNLLDDAKFYFENSTKKDIEYVPPKVNLLVTNFILNLLNKNINKKSYEELSQKIHIDNERVNDLLILHKIFSKKKIKRKEIENASLISRLNFDKHIDKKNNESVKIDVKRYNKFSYDDFLFISKPYQRISLTGSGKIILKNYDDYTLIKAAKDKFIFRVFDKDYLSYIESILNKINYSRVYDLNSKKFKLIENEKMIVVTDSDGQIIEIILF
tara:strand:+ start:344 stop:1807 length:1464 start_codon:yes stop_codon:yes gene_type:complete